MGHQNQLFGQGVGGDQGVKLTDGRSVAPQMGSDAAKLISSVNAPGQRGQFCDQQVNTPATPVRWIHHLKTVAQFGTRDRRDGDILGINAGLHARHQSGAGTFDEVADDVGVEQIANHAEALPAL